MFQLHNARNLIATYEDFVADCRAQPGKGYILHLFLKIEPVSRHMDAILRRGAPSNAIAGRVTILKRLSSDVYPGLNFQRLVAIAAIQGVKDWNAVAVAPAKKVKPKQLEELLRDMEDRVNAGMAGDFVIFSDENRPIAPTAIMAAKGETPDRARRPDTELVREGRAIASASGAAMRVIEPGGDGHRLRHNKAHRILARYKGAVVPLVWFNVSPDGSIVLGPYIRNVNFAKLGVARAKGGEVFVEYEGGEEVDLTNIQPRNKMTIHQTGCVHLFGKHRRAFRKEFASITEQEELCFFVFQHPTQYRSIAEKDLRTSDIVCNFEISDDHPFFCQAFVSPINAIRVVDYRDQRQAWRTLALCEDLPGAAQQFAYQFYLGDRAPADWPPYTFMVLRADPDNWPEGRAV